MSFVFKSVLVKISYERWIAKNVYYYEHSSEFRLVISYLSKKSSGQTVNW